MLILGLGFRVEDSGFRVWGLRFGVYGLGFRVQGLGFRVQHYLSPSTLQCMEEILHRVGAEECRSLDFVSMISSRVDGGCSGYYQGS